MAIKTIKVEVCDHCGNEFGNIRYEGDVKETVVQHNQVSTTVSPRVFCKPSCATAKDAKDVVTQHKVLRHEWVDEGDLNG